MFTRTLQSRDPFATLSSEMDRLFESLVAPSTRQFFNRVASGGFPSINMWEDENCLYAEAELPGFSMDDLELTVEGDLLSIAGQRDRNVPENARLLRSERGFGSFQRSISLPVEVDVEQIDATLRDGILLITMPKRAESRARRIEVRTLPSSQSQQVIEQKSNQSQSQSQSQN